ncbi:MAG: hypothetical protein J2P15_09200 [Micromonosporaceae bacterium]|nr:hypothetical protein [Micromonosporaceae bacterium]
MGRADLGVRAAVVPLLLGAAAAGVLACQHSATSGAAAATATSTAATATPTTPAATPTAAGAQSALPLPTATVPHEATAEVAEKFGLPKVRLDEAVIAARVAMVRTGGDHGERLNGEPDTGPLDQGKHLDPVVITGFAAKLGVPPDRAAAIMRALMAEWNEYDGQAEQLRPGAYAKAIAADARLLKISTDRAAWIESLLISRPVLGTWPAVQDPIFAAVAASLHVTQKVLAAAVDYTKTH